MNTILDTITTIPCSPFYYLIVCNLDSGTSNLLHRRCCSHPRTLMAGDSPCCQFLVWWRYPVLCDHWRKEAPPQLDTIIVLIGHTARHRLSLHIKYFQVLVDDEIGTYRANRYLVLTGGVSGSTSVKVSSKASAVTPMASFIWFRTCFTGSTPFKVSDKCCQFAS